MPVSNEPEAPDPGLVRRARRMTRALCYDADTPQDWDTLRTAARFLSYGDFCPLLEPSPVQDDDHSGGGQSILEQRKKSWRVVAGLRNDIERVSGAGRLLFCRFHKRRTDYAG